MKPLPPGYTPPESSFGATPYFGCRAIKPPASADGCDLCRGACAAPGSPFVCMDCHRTSPEREARIDAFERMRAQHRAFAERLAKLKAADEARRKKHRTKGGGAGPVQATKPSVRAASKTTPGATSVRPTPAAP